MSSFDRVIMGPCWCSCLFFCGCLRVVLRIGGALRDRIVGGDIGREGRLPVRRFMLTYKTIVSMKKTLKKK